MKVKDVMNTRRVVSLNPDDDVAFAARLMSWAGVRHLPVVDKQGVLGVFSERDYLRYLAEKGGDGAGDQVSRFMSAPANTLVPEDPAISASALLLAQHNGCVTVVDEEDGRLVGIVTASDILAADVRAAAPPVAIDIPVSRAMTSHPVVVHPEQPLLEAVALMSERGFRHVPVTSADGRLAGMISDRDIRTAIGDPIEALHRDLTELEELRISSVMTTPGESVSEDTPLFEVAHRLAHGTVGAYPVLDKANHVVGLVSYVDVMQFLLEVVADTRANVA
jgi:acetoin utilization protein AcuB